MSESGSGLECGSRVWMVAYADLPNMPAVCRKGLGAFGRSGWWL
jgi:hypothetical protein